jgi:hypothetical protein
VKPAGVALTSNAARVAGLGRVYFELLGHGFSRIRTDRSPTHHHQSQSLTEYRILIIRFLFSYNCLSTYAAEEILIVPGFPTMLRDVHKRIEARIGFALQR